VGRDEGEESRIVTGPAQKAQACKYGDHPATKSLVWAEGKAYVPVCDDHEPAARRRIAQQRDEVNRVIEITERYHPTIFHFDPHEHPRDRAGKFVDVLRLLRHNKGSSAVLPGGVRVAHSKVRGYQVTQYGQTVTRKGRAGEAAVAALGLYDRGRPKPSTLELARRAHVHAGYARLAMSEADAGDPDR
jgi:hypothetical protein